MWNDQPEDLLDVFRLTDSIVKKYPCWPLILMYAFDCAFKKNLMEVTHMKRTRLNRHQSRKLFSKTAPLVHKKNVQSAPMRGGIRL